MPRIFWEGVFFGAAGAVMAFGLFVSALVAAGY